MNNNKQSSLNEVCCNITDIQCCVNTAMACLDMVMRYCDNINQATIAEFLKPIKVTSAEE
jgi:hypothetical protein